MVYKVIGLMSGSSLDGLDIVFTVLEEVRGKWGYEIVAAECIPYTIDIINKLRNAQKLTVPDFLKLNTAYGRYTGEQINQFIEKHNLQHQVHFIASHGHTVLHEPENKTTCQIGDGATIAAVTGLPVISDLRALDVALGGQGAPIVPIGDKLLFGDYDYCLNIGGICNITVPNNGQMLAFDVCAANQVLNALSAREGKLMDENGEMAKKGRLLIDVLAVLNEHAYYKQSPPKSLSNERAMETVFPTLMESGHTIYDMLHTVVQHIADQILYAVTTFSTHKEGAKLLITGGGAFNSYLVEKITNSLRLIDVTVVVPDANTIMYKEALIMALIGTLRWREETNVMCQVTGAQKDSISGAIWMGHSFNS